MKYKRVLVTGGSGFTGSHLIESLLQQGHQVTSLDHSRNFNSAVRVIQGDVTNAQVVEKAMKGQDIVYHLAGLLGTSELQNKAAEAVEVNVIGTLNVFDAAVKHQTRVLLVSKPNPWLNTYSITKDASEKFCLMYQKDFGLNATIVKWFSVYGPGQKWHHVQKAVPTFIVDALQNKPLPVFGDGKQTADFIYVTDAISATIKVAQMQHSNGQIVEIGTGIGTPVKKLAHLIIKLCESSSKIKYQKMRIGETPHARVVANTQLLRQLVPKQQFINLADGLIQTVEYYKGVVKSEKNTRRNSP